MLESELSFLVREPPDFSGAPFKEIEQHYLDDDIEPLRIRKADGGYELTRKFSVAKDDLSRKEELTVPITAAQFVRLRTLAVRSLAKTRRYLPLSGGLTAEIDVFRGALEGLVMVEVEFTDESARAAFTPPPWFGRDVSQEAWSSNSYLAGKALADVERFLEPRS